METKYSVIIPVYNKASTLKRAIESVLSQDYRNYEIVIVNDGSTDNSLEIIEQYSKYSSVKIINQKNGGVSVARNSGIEHAAGECITFLDPDDEWKSNHLSVVNTVYNGCDKLDAIYATGYIIKMVDGRLVSMKKEVDDIILKGQKYKICDDLFKVYNKFKHGVIHTNSVMIPKRVFKNVGLFTVGCKRSQDIDMWFRTMLQYPAVIIADETTVYFRNESTATAMNTRNFEWPFFDTADRLLKENKIRAEIKDSFICFVDELRISMARHMLMNGMRKGAKEMLKKVYKRSSFDLLITYILFCCPCKLLHKIYYQINKSYYNYNNQSDSNK